MANNNKNEKGPDGLPVDHSPANFGNTDAEANAAVTEELLRLAEEQDDNLTFDTEKGEARVSQGIAINPSSTYPGRNKELAENDMRIPTPIDLAKRAAFAGTQVPARVVDSGLNVEDFRETAPATEDNA